MISDFDYEEALAACANGHRQALTDLYHQESSRLLSVVMRILKCPSLSEDVVHDAFVKIWANAGSFHPRLGSARGWIYVLTRNLALNALEKHQRQIQTEPEFLLDLIDQESIDSPSMTLDVLEQQELFKCLDTLEPQQKLCVLHAYVDGYTQDEISGLLDKPLGTVKSWIRRSLQSLKDCLK